MKINMPQRSWQELPGMLPPQSIREFRGLSTYDPLSIADSYFTDMANLVCDDYPTISTRPGHTVLGSAIGSKVLGLGVWEGQELHAVFNDGTWRKWTGIAWTTLASGLNTTAEWTFTNFQGNLDAINLIGSNGVDPIKRYDGGTVQNLTGAPSGGKYITTYQNRLWCAKGKELYSCALDRPDKWDLFGGTDEDSYVKDTEPASGLDINSLNGGLRKLVIGFPGEIHELNGNYPSDFFTIKVTEDEGTVNNKSAFTQEGVMRFMHSTGIYEYGGGVLPEKDFSDIVKGYYASVGSQSAAGSDGSKLYFSLGSDSTLVYDPRKNIQAWCRWTNLNPTCFASMNHELYIGDSLGRVIKIGGATDNGAAIPWYGISRLFGSASLAQQQRWYKLWIVADLAAGSTLQVFLSRSMSGDDWVELTPYMQGNRVIIPVSSFANENYLRIKLSGTGPVKIREITRQVRQMPFS